MPLHEKYQGSCLVQLACSPLLAYWPQGAAVPLDPGVHLGIGDLWTSEDAQSETCSSDCSDPRLAMSPWTWAWYMIFITVLMPWHLNC